VHKVNPWSPESSIRVSTPVATLGPADTDAQAVAQTISDEVVLCDSFPAAMEYARTHDSYALICAGYIKQQPAEDPASWVSLHFESVTTMQLVDVWFQPTKPMCLALNSATEDVATVRTVALHPATKAFADQYLPHARQLYVEAKPLAVAQAAAGLADACIGSLDVVANHHNLSAVEVFQPDMVWCLYRSRSE
jgi:hypothetical protein